MTQSATYNQKRLTSEWICITMCDISMNIATFQEEWPGMKPRCQKPEFSPLKSTEAGSSLQSTQCHHQQSFASQWPNEAEVDNVKITERNSFFLKNSQQFFCGNFRLTTFDTKWWSRSWSSVDSCSGKVPVANVGWRSVDQLSPWLIFLKYNLWQFWQIFTKSNQYALLKGGLDVQLTIGKLHALCNASQCLSPIFES